MKGILKITIACLVYIPSWAQLSDNFSDGDFNTNPEWGGNTSDFIVETEVLRLNAPAVTSTSYVSTASDISQEAEWSFWGKLDFNPSSNNYMKVYLMSDVADLTAVANGYFVKIGGAPDDISLYKVANGEETLLIDGVDGRVDLSSVEVDILVTRDINGLWEMKSRLLGEVDFVAEEPAMDLEIEASAYFGVSCTYTSTRSTKMYLDDVSVTGSPYVDMDAPELISYSTPVTNQIQLVFNEPLDPTESENKPNYLLNGDLQPGLVTLMNENAVLLEFTQNLQIINTLSISGLPDLAGNGLDALLEIVFVDPSPHTYGEVVFNELLPDPNPQEDLPAYEFVEILNVSDRIINLADWTFTDGSTLSTIPEQLLYPDSLLILCPQEAVPFYQEFGTTLGLSKWPSLNNSGDSLRLADTNGTVIDALGYTLDWYKDEAKSNGGWSLEQINPHSKCAGGFNWAAAIEVGGGTPGQVNSLIDTSDSEFPLITQAILKEGYAKITFSELLLPKDYTSTIRPGMFENNFDIFSPSDTVTFEVAQSLNLSEAYKIESELEDCAGNKGLAQADIIVVDTPLFGDVVFNEVFPDPTPSEELPAFEFIEILNTSNKVLDVYGWVFSANSSEVVLPGKLLFPDSVLIICPQEALSAFQTYGDVIGLNDWPGLTNSGSTLRLTDSDGVALDSLMYDLDWYGNPSKDDGGWSLERISPTSKCAGIYNWSSSVNPNGGTPGKWNSLYDETGDQTLPFIKEAIAKEGNVKLVFSEPIVANSYQAKITPGSVEQTFNLPVPAEETSFTWAETLNVSGNSSLEANIEDCAGNTNQAKADLILVEQPDFKDVRFNEIFPDPSPQVGLPEHEFVEILNASDKVFDLSEWKFMLNSKEAIISGKLLYPDSIMILCAPEAEKDYSDFGPTMGLDNWPALTNSGAFLQLISDKGTTVDSLRYSVSWYHDGSKNDGGWSLELINPLSKCKGAYNWGASSNATGGTPGKANSRFLENEDAVEPTIKGALSENDSIKLWLSEPTVQGNYQALIFPGQMAVHFSINEPANYLAGSLATPLNLEQAYTIDIALEDCSGNAANNAASFTPLATPSEGDLVLNELLFDPYTAGEDFVELYNTTPYHFNLKDFKIENETTHKIISDSILILEPGHYLALSEDIVFLKNQYLAPDSSLFKTSLPTMPNDEGIVMLKDNKGVLLDSVFYSEDYHFVLLANPEGVSLERVLPEEDSNNPDNWKSAAETSGFATPGYANSQSVQPVKKGTVTVNPQVITPDNDGQSDFCQISFALTGSDKVMSINVYNLNGQLVKTLANNVLISSQGFFTWDGTNQQGGTLPTAHYVVITEMIGSDGRTQRFMNKVVVANGF